ncbi:TetR/AcrR family transcriptional regulator [Nucisporomicrobium flavum]|uniref:TetR/AcrR family transcriptional regulator n=1 Tax=Nucisporomicrobium flavum TaxID=2785915 RepID=UPI0018F3BBE7|nr:TetR/AcrR family transcriptional regulator [Nucisporomicrobium flavum]
MIRNAANGLSGPSEPRDSARRPVRPALSRDFIIKTALEMVDTRGIGQLSMRKLGAELGVDPMAIYYYLPNKQALFDGLVEAVYAEIQIDVDGEASDSWRSTLVAFARQLRTVLGRHPDMLPMVATRPVFSPAVLGFGERAVVQLGAVGFTGQQALQLVNCLRTFTVGHAFAELSEPVGAPAPSQDEVAAVIAERYPKLADAIAGGYQPDVEYEAGLQAMLDGFELLRPPAGEAGPGS